MPSSPMHGKTTVSEQISASHTIRAYSKYFDMPLKDAAEHFGIRATAFKKRCRAVGIRHWPYRKVKSLQRALANFDKLHPFGPLTERLHRQRKKYQSQLDRMQSPIAYGYLGQVLQFDEDCSSSDYDSSDIPSVVSSPSPSDMQDDPEDDLAFDTIANLLPPFRTALAAENNLAKTILDCKKRRYPTLKTVLPKAVPFHYDPFFQSNEDTNNQYMPDDHLLTNSHLERTPVHMEDNQCQLLDSLDMCFIDDEMYPNNNHTFQTHTDTVVSTEYAVCFHDPSDLLLENEHISNGKHFLDDMLDLPHDFDEPTTPQY